MWSYGARYCLNSSIHGVMSQNHPPDSHPNSPRDFYRPSIRAELAVLFAQYPLSENLRGLRLWATDQQLQQLLTNAPTPQIAHFTDLIKHLSGAIEVADALERLQQSTDDELSAEF